jgi:hypothetical protein
MTDRSAIRAYAACCVALVFAVSPASAQAQLQPKPLSEPATGEKYHIEGAAGFWFPTATMLVSSESLGIAGTTIDFKTDLGLQDKHLPDLRVVLSPSRRHKFRFEFIPIKYDQNGTVRRTIIFNGQRYDVGLPVHSVLDWRAYRIAYEFDFVSTDRGFAGFVVEAKYTDVQVNLASTAPTVVINEFARASAPIPAIGGIGRFYVVPNISITGELTGFKLPQHLIEGTSAHYVDFDLYGTVNFTNNVGAQFGYRSLDVGYVVNTGRDSGTFTLKGIYFGVVARY